MPFADPLQLQRSANDDAGFASIQGTIYVTYRDADGQHQMATVQAGEVMIINAYTPHSPIRPPETLGLVIDRPRVHGEKDGIVWYCDACGAPFAHLAASVARHGG